MKIAALTMVYRDHWFLSRWLDHYGRHFGQEHLYIVSHGDERPIRRMCKKANVIGIQRETQGDFDVLRWKFLNDIMRLLQKSYDCVVVGDVDELIVPLPAHGTDLVAQIAQRGPYPVSFVTGVELIEQAKDAALDDTKPLLSQRRAGIWNWRYTKAAVVYDAVRIGRGAHFAWRTPYRNAENLILLHLKFANSAIFDKVVESRAEIRQIGSDGKSRTPRGNGWTPDAMVTVQQKMETLPAVEFHEGLAQFRAGTTPEVADRKQTYPARFFLNAKFELPHTFSDLL